MRGLLSSLSRGAFTIALALLLSIGAHAGERREVAVGIYHFAPFAFEDSNTKPSGMTYDLVDALNQLQHQYHFSLFKTTPSGRYKAFERNHFDMMVFESKLWGWQDRPMLASKVFLKGGEVYITLKKPGRDQSFFNNVGDKSIIGIRGYHYGFANFNSDQEYLKQNFKILLTHSNESSIRMLLGGRGDVAVVTQSYLQLYLKHNPEAADKLLISEKLDQEYQHTFLIRDGHDITPEQINVWLQQLKSNGTLDDIWRKWGLN
ncbi:MAG: transporter substrate-binding domain-containing protein [Candidatus Pelagadaptatus aseana]|uniref:substrate-binding periplasmic protein n=1 Tax=Candidatus Pelagadaptatus aseana TaxID=3120508 RepID=UPI0039B186ED